MMTDEEIEAEALRRFLWCFSPESDKEDARDRIASAKRVAAGKKPKAPRDWEPTRQKAKREAAEMLKAQESCAYCRRSMVPWTDTHPTKDHIVPASRGGAETVLCCHQCNQMKADAMPEEWDAFMKANPSWWLTGRKFMPSQPPTWTGVCPALAACSFALVEARYYRKR